MYLWSLHDSIRPPLATRIYILTVGNERSKVEIIFHWILDDRLETGWLQGCCNCTYEWALLPVQLYTNVFLESIRLQQADILMSQW